MSPTTTPQLNWKKDDIDQNKDLAFINWAALKHHAAATRHHLDGVESSCHLSAEYNMGGLHVVRRIAFDDGTQWVARLQLRPPTPSSTQRLQTEIHTMAAVRSRSRIPVPRVFAHDTNELNDVGAAFMLMEFVPGDTAMDSFGGWDVHKGATPAQFRDKFHAALAEIQTEMSSIRFPQIGTITLRDDGEFDVGPIPGLGGPFNTAAEYFEAWAQTAKFPYKEATIRQRTPKDLVEEVLSAIRTFPSRVQEELAGGGFPFREGPFPLVHTDLYSSNVIVDADYNVLSVIDWEGALVVPWEVVEFVKVLSVVPPAMDGPLFKMTKEKEAMERAREGYMRLVRKVEGERGFDAKLSRVLSDEKLQAFAHAFWLYGDGRIGYYDRVLEDLLLSVGGEKKINSTEWYLPLQLPV